LKRDGETQSILGFERFGSLSLARCLRMRENLDCILRVRPVLMEYDEIKVHLFGLAKRWPVV